MKKKDIILKADNISKQYKLGLVGTGSINDDLKRWWYKIRGKENPFLKIGESNDRSTKGSSDYVWALQDINFEVERGEVVGIIGKNGAGKSTLLKILSKVTSPTTGEIKTKGRIASLLEVGTGFHGEMTGRENIYLNGAILGMTKKEIASKIDEIIDFSGCQRYIDTPVKRYSSGMTVRLAFAVAAFLEPEILVIDEVLAVGDAEFQKKAIGKMQDISKGEGRTVLFVSHNMAAVKNLCTRAIVLEHGKTVFEGGVDEAVDFYINMNVTPNSLPLHKRNDRKGYGDFLFWDIIKQKEDGSVSNIFLSGDTIIFVIQIKNKFKREIKDIRVDFGLNNSRDIRISWFSTSIFKERIVLNESKEDIEIHLEINNLPLKAGNYSLTANLIVDGVPQDWISNAVYFDIENGDFFKTGKIISSNQGDFLIKHKFLLNDE
ncbi:ABC transporter ATP-binding protein [Tamlana sp. s12]|uniref:ABC transporter ATP-binding protein n=1 Tax=Tamlana sp. s12 TaxID=1630406 RepID=UPI0007FF252D|nr:ABC transporter ATP-binding protein [Tamlana sp. s12]OBQ55402.1 ABC transporter ATP-binding protein [Tamlana sp. s12]QQY80914.1 ABC transporter ATP-binding protein [Tamlana sp. s12]